MSATPGESNEVWGPFSAIREWMGLVLVALLIFSIVLATAGFVASFDGRRRMAAFEADGRGAIATITNKYARTIDREFWNRAFDPHGANEAYWISFCFRMQDRGYHCGALSVPTATFDGLRVGSSLKVTYVPWHPDWYYAGDEAPVDPDSDIFTHMFQWGTLSGLLIFIAMAAIALWPSDQAMATRGSQTGDVASSFRQRHGLGKRR